MSPILRSSYDRRRFVRRAAAGSALLIVLCDLEASGLGRPRHVQPLRILILGGTGFIGPHQVRYAAGRGHTVTVFNRGIRDATLPPGVEQLLGDRNGDLRALERRDWEALRPAEGARGAGGRALVPG